MAPLSILVVDDDRDFAESLAEVLGSRGCLACVVYSGEEAVERLADETFDVVLMDVRLPGKNGVESLLEMRKRLPGIKVIMMTGYSVPQLIEQAVENGAWDVMYKPLDVDQVLARLERLEPAGILVAEDDPDFAESVRDLLERQGYRTLLARNGRQAIEYLRRHEVAALILDLRLPVMSGLEVYRELRESGRAVPTILVTAFPREESQAISRMADWSISGVLTKPFEPDDLLRIVHHVARRHEP